jgi:hypothetical protein
MDMTLITETALIGGFIVVGAGPVTDAVLKVTDWSRKGRAARTKALNETLDRIRSQATATPAAEVALAGVAGPATLTNSHAEAHARRQRYARLRLEGHPSIDAAAAIGVTAKTTRQGYESWYASHAGAMNGVAS